MKYTDGRWRVREGYTFNWMGNVERVKVGDDQVDLLLMRIKEHRGHTLNIGTITATVRSPLEGVVAVKFAHWTSEEDVGPRFSISEQKPKVEITNVPNKSLDFSTGKLDLSVNTELNKFAVKYSSGGTKLTGHSLRSVGHVTSTNTSLYNPADGMFATKDGYLLLGLDLAVNEKIYGLGERFGAFVKNGQVVDIWNEDGGTSSELTYKNIPFYISSAGYGVFINHPGKVMLEVQSEHTTRVNISVQAEELEYMIIAGPTPKDILNRYTALTGRPGLPPAWSYGLWLTTSFTTDYDEKTVTGFMDGLEQRNIPLSVFHFDSFYMKSFQWCDFDFDTDRFSDAPGYLRRLKDRGLKLCVWVNPYIAQASPLFAEGKKHGYFIMRANAARPTVWQTDLWQAGMAVVDFTNPAACNWYNSKLNKFIDMGVDSFKTDFGERIPFDPAQVKYHDGSDPIRMHNYYAILYNKVVYENMSKQGKEACLFARAATVGSQKFPVHWGGDCESTFEAMAETLRGGLSLSLSGFAFWAHDIGGFDGKPEPGLYKRWVQFGLLGSHSRLHGSSSYRVPWIYGEEEYPGEEEKCSKVLRESVFRKLALMPYLLRTALEGEQKGTPVMRAMLVEFPDDRNVWTLDTQFMLGSELLVAPVFDMSGLVSFYVPITEEGKSGAKWRSWFDHAKTYEEGRWYTETHGFDTLPLLVRPGAVVAMNTGLSKPEGDMLSGLEVLVNGPLERDRDVEIVEASDVAKVSRVFSVGKGMEVRGLEVKILDMTQV